MCKERKLGNDIRVIHNMIGMYCDRYGADHRDGVAPMQGRTLGFLYCNKDKSSLINAFTGQQQAKCYSLWRKRS